MHYQPLFVRWVQHTGRPSPVRRALSSTTHTRRQARVRSHSPCHACAPSLARVICGPQRERERVTPVARANRGPARRALWPALHNSRNSLSGLASRAISSQQPLLSPPSPPSPTRLSRPPPRRVSPRERWAQQPGTLPPCSSRMYLLVGVGASARARSLCGARAAATPLTQSSLRWR